MRINLTKLALRLALSFGLFVQVCGENFKDDRSVSIVTFRPKKIWTNWIKSPTAITNRFIATKEITICLRYMTFKNKAPLVLVETAQIKLMFHKSIGFVILRPWNATTSNDEYRRIIKFCEPHKPGHWLSLCIKVKLLNNTQDITHFEDGRKCSHTTYSDGHFDKLYFQRGGKYFEDLLR